jgi:phage/plasmid-associated DNA primase
MLFASTHLPDYVDNAGQMARRLVVVQFRRRVDRRDTTLTSRILATEMPAIILRALRAYLATTRLHPSEDFWEWCPPELKTAQQELACAASFVRRFLALDEDSEEALIDDYGNRTYTRPADGFHTSLRALKEAYSVFMRRHHREAIKDEAMDKLALQLAGWTVEDDVNLCKACSMHAQHPLKCCDHYDSCKRSKLTAVKGLRLIRTMDEIEL